MNDRQKKYSRFRFVSAPLAPITNNEEIRKPDFPFADLLAKSRYPVRALRYWWLNCAIEEEARRVGASKPIVIADVGCDRGIIKRFVAPVKNARWIGLDLITNRPGLELAKYDELYQCDFDVGLPLGDASVDIAIFSHVLEHLPRPEFTLREIWRVLRPGGMLLIGVPTAPKIIAQMRERQFARQMQKGTRTRGQHVSVFWSKRLRRLAETIGFQVEFASGTAMIRKQGSRLENYAFWIRFNQVWAALFPSLGQELCVQLRKPAN